MLHSGMNTNPTCRNTLQQGAKRVQHVAPNNVAMCCAEMLRSFGWSMQMLGQQCWDMLRSFGRSLKPRPNDRNIWTQHFATLLGAACCAHLATMLRRIAACCELKIELVRMPWRNIVARTRPNDHNITQQPQMLREKFDHFQIWGNNTQHVTTHRNKSQHGDQKRATCCDMLRWNVGIVWSALINSAENACCPSKVASCVKVMEVSALLFS